MTDNTKPTPGSDEYWEWVRKRAEARGKQLSGADTADFEESGLLVGGEEALRSTDAESFPDEAEEYTPEERKPKLVKNLQHERKMSRVILKKWIAIKINS